jgi:hypothetical protein
MTPRTPEDRASGRLARSMVEEHHPRIWPAALALTAVFLVGGAIGYLVGRPSRAPEPYRALRPGQVHVPNLTGLGMADARRVLGPLGLGARRARTVRSIQFPAGFVAGQTPGPGTTVATGSRVGLQLSSGPGPPPGPRLVFARSVLIPIVRLGPYTWTSSRVAMDGPAVSLGANTRVIGAAEVTPYQVAAQPGPTGSGLTVTFRVTRYRGAAWYAIVRAFGRQRESSGRGPRMTVRRRSAGRLIEIAGHACRASGSGAARLSVEVVGAGSASVAVRPLANVAVYAFRVRIPFADVPRGRVLRFRVGQTRCVSRTLPRASLDAITRR